MKKIKTKWQKNGKEIDAYVHISDIVIMKGKFPAGRGGGGSPPIVPPDYGSMISYYISEDEEGKVIISRGQMVDNFDMDDISSVQDFAINTLKKNKHLKKMKEE